MLALSLPPALPPLAPLDAVAALPAFGLGEVAWQGPSEAWPGPTEPGREGRESAAQPSLPSMLLGTAGVPPRVDVGTMAGRGTATGMVTAGRGKAAPSCRLLLCIRAATVGCAARQVGVSTPSAPEAAPVSGSGSCAGSGSGGAAVLPEHAGSKALGCGLSPWKALRDGRKQGRDAQMSGQERTGRIRVPAAGARFPPAGASPHTQRA